MTAPVPSIPLLSVLRGNPSPEELAALVAVLTTRVASSATDAATDAPSGARPWAAPRLRSPLPPGPGAWRASALPR